ncbi:hypothetical protein NDU88_003382 [Pleurodeles waltl]|uniref:Uncharacterized protein n=1 Tax=Pleurodeles waltl TaxID=8319 RepID=A0AAV7V285_PLEWA|nr:hypothetical protein NDU88_003382 [Pleurodeles waltl]
MSGGTIRVDLKGGGDEPGEVDEEGGCDKKSAGGLWGSAERRQPSHCPSQSSWYAQERRARRTSQARCVPRQLIALAQLAADWPARLARGTRVTGGKARGTFLARSCHRVTGAGLRFILRTKDAAALGEPSARSAQVSSRRFTVPWQSFPCHKAHRHTYGYPYAICADYLLLRPVPDACDLP